MTADAVRPQSFAFASFRLDLRSGRLLQGDAPIPLRPKTWSVLLYLVERSGELVSKDDLLDAVWPNVAVTPDTLTKSIGELRRALGDDPAAPRFIATVHRRGFRFIGGAPDSGDLAAREAADDRSAARPVVGRAAELQRLADALARAKAGTRQIVLITGQAGVGKTTLLDTFLARAASSDAALWIGHGASIEQHGPREPYMPVLKALDRLARRPDGERLAGLLRRAAPTWLAQMPWLIGDDEDALRRSLLSARAERMLREFGALVEALTTEVTLLLALEDLHWCDPATIDLLGMLAQRREPARLLVIATYRPAEVAVREHRAGPAVHGTCSCAASASSCPYTSSPRPTCASYLARRFPGAALPATLAARLHRHTDGNPLFVTAVVEHMLSRGWILRHGIRDGRSPRRWRRSTSAPRRRPAHDRGAVRGPRAPRIAACSSPPASPGPSSRRRRSPRHCAASSTRSRHAARRWRARSGSCASPAASEWPGRQPWRCASPSPTSCYRQAVYEGDSGRDPDSDCISASGKPWRPLTASARARSRPSSRAISRRRRSPRAPCATWPRGARRGPPALCRPRGRRLPRTAIALTARLARRATRRRHELELRLRWRPC